MLIAIEHFIKVAQTTDDEVAEKLTVVFFPYS